MKFSLGDKVVISDLAPAQWERVGVPQTVVGTVIEVGGDLGEDFYKVNFPGTGAEGLGDEWVVWDADLKPHIPKG